MCQYMWSEDEIKTPRKYRSKVLTGVNLAYITSRFVLLF